MTSEQQARKPIDELLSKAGWIIQNAAEAYIFAGVSVIEAKKEGATLSGVEILFPQLRRFGQLLADPPDAKWDTAGSPRLFLFDAADACQSEGSKCISPI